MPSINTCKPFRKPEVWRKEQPTEVQIDLLKQWGIKPGKTRGSCSDLIARNKDKLRTRQIGVFR